MHGWIECPRCSYTYSVPLSSRSVQHSQNSYASGRGTNHAVCRGWPAIAVVVAATTVTLLKQNLRSTCALQLGLLLLVVHIHPKAMVRAQGSLAHPPFHGWLQGEYANQSSAAVGPPMRMKTTISNRVLQSDIRFVLHTLKDRRSILDSVVFIQYRSSHGFTSS